MIFRNIGATKSASKVNRKSGKERERSIKKDMETQRETERNRDRGDRWRHFVSRPLRPLRNRGR